MNKMQLKNIKITNFKNMANYSQNFDDCTIIRGKFGSGKSTIYNAYKWALGLPVKNYEPSKDGEIIKGLTTSVEISFEVNGLEYTLKRDSIRKGTELTNKFWFCGYPVVTLKEYTNKILNIFNVDSKTFNLVFDIRAFNETNTTTWNWDSQRKYLFDIFNVDESVNEILKQEKYAYIKREMTIDKSIDEAKILKKLKAEGIANNKQIESNNVIISDTQSQIEELSKIDFNALENEKSELKDKIDSIKNNTRNSKEIADCNIALANLHKELSEVEQEIRKEEMNISTQKKNIEENLNSILQKKEVLATQKSSTMELYKQTNALCEQMKTSIEESVCPTCGQKVENSENIKNEYAQLKQKRDDLFDKYNSLKDEIETLAYAYSTFYEKYTAIKERKVSQDKLQKSKDIELQIVEVNNKIDTLKNGNGEINNLSALESRVEEIIKQLANRSNLANLTAKIENLKASNIEIAKKEQKRLEYIDLVNEFIKEKVITATDKVNKNFENVKFVFFKPLLGDENSMENTCTSIYKESTYEQCSVGQKIASDFYINQGLQKHFDLSVPVWVDDMGSAMKFDCEQQFIGLLTDNSADLEYEKIRANA